jgi:hypothetical protein
MRAALLVMIGVSVVLSNVSIADETAKASSVQAVAAKQPEAMHKMLKGVDSDGDGIRDDVASLVVTKPVSEGVAASKVGAELDAALANSGPPKLEQPRRTCLDYLLLEPEDQMATNRYLQAETSGTFGTHPCDPIASPLLERPFENSVAVVPLGPVNFRYAKHD